MFLQSKGISAGELAVLSFIAQILAFGSRLLAAVLADRTGRHKIVRPALFCSVVHSLAFAISAYL